ncbi:hypothetical protein [Oceanicella actignis]|uniref:AAA+ family ATPase n=1 Tax=Oceanicella actignis TaxID=1189325 RepID=A0A1M7S8F8_9RHOB|nr:hypothetical protein [Oceanicella actignis]TYO91624.1 hypothetical protein LY05_00481 [Oceanicella actignis]SET31493.1 hypothetical protein SAMN04488119_103443 [Oceanicella actignis]SHN54949.1 hypothetical protein SAMN05216200_10265 [Oceanicella actignis]
MNRHRTHLAAALVLALAAPAAAEPPGAGPDAPPERPLAEELERAARDALESLTRQLGPALRGLQETLGALDDYDAPRILPNGDILIPRKRPSPAPPDAPEHAPDTDAPETLEL